MYGYYKILENSSRLYETFLVWVNALYNYFYFQYKHKQYAVQHYFVVSTCF